MMPLLTANSFFELADYEHRRLFTEAEPVWTALGRLKGYLDDYPFPSLPAGVTPSLPLTATLVLHEGEVLEAKGLAIVYGDVTKGGLKVSRGGHELAGATVLMAGVVLHGERFAFGRGVLVESGAFITGPTVLGDCSEVRQGAYLRGNCLVGKRCVVGHVTEVKHTIFLDDAKAGHFAYLGDSILGNQVNLGAGTKMANLRFVKGNVRVRTPAGTLDSGLRKFGAVLGDQVQTGCNSVTSPGTVIGRRSFLLPNTTAPSGYHPDNSMLRP
jgi:bifunctional N-acetylglucosamine-1-phosphate-uridyltransferase/glucosamine-1-phosphate-acetyltransferase GlmU-like protein